MLEVFVTDLILVLLNYIMMSILYNYIMMKILLYGCLLHDLMEVKIFMILQNSRVTQS